MGADDAPMFRSFLLVSRSEYCVTVKNCGTSERRQRQSFGPAVYASLSSTARIACPIIAYPEPNIIWFKDKFPLELSDRITFSDGILSIEDVKDEDAGVYRCEASNQFPVQIDGPEQSFVVKLDQELRIGDGYAWMLPLAIILIILLLLFLIIFTCQRCTKYKADQYNVADRERALHNDQVPLKNSV
uniref:Ig-like domain-containing protein n=1 Tax=Caenorhabditis japonica TaxID=281687 RepID=A0A8R1EG76_CAEJA